MPHLTRAPERVSSEVGAEVIAYCVMGVSVCAGLMVVENMLSAFSDAHMDLDQPRKPHLARNRFHFQAGSKG
jgi:hypothetical protein